VRDDPPRPLRRGNLEHVHFNLQHALRWRGPLHILSISGLYLKYSRRAQKAAHQPTALAKSLRQIKRKMLQPFPDAPKAQNPIAQPIGPPDGLVDD
jgi:hypothetical protein